VILRVTIARLFCLRCTETLAERCPLADGKRHYTRALERYAVMLCRLMTISDVATHLGLAWDTVKAMEKRYLKRRFDLPPLRGVRRIAIDEIAVRKGHVYKTIVLDLDSGHILHVGDGKGADALTAFFQRLRRARVKLDAIAMDMSSAYLAAVRAFAPGTPIVFDRFHVMKLVNAQIDELRRAHMRGTATAERKFVKGVRYLLLMSPKTLDEHEGAHPGSKARLKEALALNEPLNKAYYLKEKIRCVWEEPTRRRGERVLRECIAEAASSGVRELVKLAKTLEQHKHGIVAFFDHRISSGPLEGTNNKIKVLKRRAYGYRDDEFFRLKLLGLHEARHEFIG
jgi:transposase